MGQSYTFCFTFSVAFKYFQGRSRSHVGQGHSVTIEEEGRWINCNDLVIKHTRLPAHLSNGYIRFYVHM